LHENLFEHFIFQRCLKVHRPTLVSAVHVRVHDNVSDRSWPMTLF